MIKSISFKNYRSFKTKQTINLKPITILVGPNSSGKSSILKLFGLIKQSISSEDGEFINFKGKEVDLGRLEDVLHKQKDGELELSIECPLFMPRIEISNKMDETEYGNDLVETGYSIKYNLIINPLTKSKKKTILGTHPWSEYSQKNRDRWRRFHDSSIIGTSNIQIYTNDNELLDSKKFNRISSDNVGRKNMFTLTDFRSKNDSNEIEMIRTKIKEYLSIYIKILKKVNTIYSSSRILNKIIDENIWFWKYEKWFEGKSFCPETYLESGNTRYDPIEIAFRPTPIHDYLDWKNIPIQQYWKYRKNWQTSGDEILDAKKSLKRNENKGDLNEGDEYDNRKIILKRIKKHWMEINSSGLLDKKNYYEYIEQTIFWYINDLIIDYWEITSTKLKPNKESIIGMDTLERTNVYCQVVSKSIDIACSNIIAINALRPSPKPYYTFDEMKSIIGEEEVKTIINRKDSEDEYRYEISEKYLSILGFDHHVIIEQIDKEGGLFSIMLRSRKDNLSMTVDKFGFGFSQILPLVFARSLYGRSVIIEQPELHLHPKSQSRLADFFVFRVSTTFTDIKTFATKIIVENNLKSYVENQFFIETHSEHLIRRLQVLIARGELSNEDVAIYYVDKNRLGNSFVKEYKINERGFFDEAWPEGFFDNISNSLMELWKTR